MGGSLTSSSISSNLFNGFYISSFTEGLIIIFASEPTMKLEKSAEFLLRTSDLTCSISIEAGTLLVGLSYYSSSSFCFFVG